jgi:hypothetical protein
VGAHPVSLMRCRVRLKLPGAVVSFSRG